MSGSMSAVTQQVDDFNTVSMPTPTPTPRREEAEAEETPRIRSQRPDSAQSDPGVIGGVGRESLEEDLIKPPTKQPQPSTKQPQPPTKQPQPSTKQPQSPSPPSHQPAALVDEAEVAAESPDRELLARSSRPANTPTTPFAGVSRRLGASRPSQHTATSQQRHMYFEHAVNLVAARCATNTRSVAANPLSPDSDPPPGFGAPRFFYVRQERPRPMTPLKAWSGYHGNVYFSPLRIEQASYSHPDSQLSLPDLPTCSDPLRRVLESSRLNAEHLMRLRARAAAGPRQPARRRWTTAGAAFSGPQPVLAELDRACLASRGGAGSVADSRDVHIYRSAHATGTLQFDPSPCQHLDQGARVSAAAASVSAGRVYRGSVSRKLRSLRQAMSVSGQPERHTAAAAAVAAAAVGRHNTSLSSLDREIDRLYDRVPTLMAGVTRSEAVARRQQHRLVGRGGKEF